MTHSPRARTPKEKKKLHTSPDRCLPRATGLEFSEQPLQNPGASPQCIVKSILRRLLNLRPFCARELLSSKSQAPDGGVDFISLQYDVGEGEQIDPSSDRFLPAATGLEFISEQPSENPAALHGVSGHVHS